MAIPPLGVDAYRELVRQALAEDIGAGDVTSQLTIDPHQRARGVIIAKQQLVLAGLDIAAEVFRQCDSTVSFEARSRDGERCDSGTVVAEVSGLARALLSAERTALNFLQRLSGIATQTAQYVEAAAGRIVVLDTRKTTPTFRDLEKYAVRCGGGTNHRQRLDDGVLIKDNHKRLAGGIEQALRSAAASSLPVEIEVETLDELDLALAAGARRVLVDNFSLEDQREAVKRSRGRAAVEISGGVTLERLHEIAGTGAEFVSVGALTHSVRAADLSFEIQGVLSTPPDIAAAFTTAARSAGLPLDGRWFPSVSSTMDVALEEAERGAREGLVIVAAEQTRGRGRRGRTWSSPPGGGLYLSFLFRPPASECASLSLLTLAAGVAVQRAVANASGLEAQLKWPNDVMVGRRKLAGILAEGVGVGGPAPCIILGIGINVRRSAHPDEVAARVTSLEDELGRTVPQGTVLEEILVQTRRVYDELRHGGADDILRAWRRAAPSAEGSTVEWQTPEGGRHGITTGIDTDGALLVRTSAGVERIVGGEVTWR